MADGAAGAMTPGRWYTLPLGYVAQPVGGGEHQGTKWMLNRVYDPRGHLDHDLTYWEISQLAGDPAPRSVSFGELQRPRIKFSTFCRTTPPLKEIEGWIRQARKRAPAAATRERLPASTPRHQPTALPS
jgi:hypothetical protein